MAFSQHKQGSIVPSQQSPFSSVVSRRGYFRDDLRSKLASEEKLTPEEQKSINPFQKKSLELVFQHRETWQQNVRNSSLVNKAQVLEKENHLYNNIFRVASLLKKESKSSGFDDKQTDVQIECFLKDILFNNFKFLNEPPQENVLAKIETSEDRLSFSAQHAFARIPVQKLIYFIKAVVEQACRLAKACEEKKGFSFTFYKKKTKTRSENEKMYRDLMDTFKSYPDAHPVLGLLIAQLTDFVCGQVFEEPLKRIFIEQDLLSQQIITIELQSSNDGGENVELNSLKSREKTLLTDGHKMQPAMSKVIQKAVDEQVTLLNKDLSINHFHRLLALLLHYLRLYFENAEANAKGYVKSDLKNLRSPAKAYSEILEELSRAAPEQEHNRELLKVINLTTNKELFKEELRREFQLDTSAQLKENHLKAPGC